MKQHTIDQKIAVLQSINLGLLLENSKPMTIFGDNLKNLLVENHNKQNFNSISNMLSAASHCLASKDQNMIEIGNSIVEGMKSSLDARMIYCLESVQSNPTFEDNPLAVQLCEKLETILALESMEEKINSIRSGTLTSYKTVSTLVDFVHEAVQIKVDEEIVENVYTRAFHPIVFTEEGKNDEVFVKLSNKVFSIKGANVVETVSPSPKFSYLSSIIESLKYDSVKKAFIHVDEKLGEFKITESGIFRNTDMIVENFDHSNFIKEMGILAESLGSNQAEISRNQQVVDGMLSMHHNYGNIALADNILIVENLRNHEKYSIIVNENSSAYVATLSSLRYPNTLQFFNRIDEALELVNKRSGYDASEFFAKYVAEQAQIDEKSSIIAEQYNTLIEELESREVQVVQKITEAKGEMKFNKVKALEESLVVIQSTILEQKQNFAKQFAK